MLHCVNVTLYDIPLFYDCTTIPCCNLFTNTKCYTNAIFHYVMLHFFDIDLFDIELFDGELLLCCTK